MVCDRCVRVVREELERAGYGVVRVALGEATISDGKAADLPAIKRILLENGFDLIEDKNAKVIEQVKTTVISLIRSAGSAGDHPGKKQKLSVVLARDLGMEYTRLSALFSSVENMTIEHFVILQKIEFAKELLKYGELTLSEIAYRLGYSSVQHLSTQFRSVTGLTPTHFRKRRSASRKPIDHLS
jgi:YesN/AraC family two-component response regulator